MFERRTKFNGIKTAKEYQRGELAKDILRVVGAGVVVGGTAIVAPNVLQVIDLFDPKGRAERNRIWKTIKYLEERDRLTIYERDGVRMVRLTQRGSMELEENALWELQVQKPWKWDHKWRLVMFDIPNQNEKVRRVFRQKLQDFGLAMYQESVFIYPHECREEVFAVADFYGVRKHVRYLVAVEIADMRDFVKHFDLL